MPKRGFTFIELLLVLAIVAVGLTLTLPVVYQSAQDARRNQCKNNLKRIGLALHNYHDTFRVFPPGWVSSDGAPGTGARMGWQTFILPYVDQVPLSRQINFNLPPSELDGKPLKLFQTVISGYRCPSDTTPETNSLRNGYGTSNYSGNYGHVPPPRLRPLGLSDFWPGAVAAPMQSRGLFARNSSVGMRHILDGTSNTIMVGERCFTSGSGIWAGVSDNAHEDDALTDCSHRSQPNASWFSFSSRHSGGVTILMCDGAVRFIQDSIDSKPGLKLGTLQSLGGRDDGQTLGAY
ncbi:MAG: DUF1559 domain-containing protein [Planctomycetales bacterium]|nr:DUF1559 domain-containing protein [Planctomycetales bacterium]